MVVSKGYTMSKYTKKNRILDSILSLYKNKDKKGLILIGDLYPNFKPTAIKYMLRLDREL